MTSLPDKIYSVAAVREIDRGVIDDAGVPGYTLMSRAGAAALEAIRQRFPDAKHWQVVCGAGNNAGDGYVVARLAAADGIAVSVLSLVDPSALGGDAATAYADFAAAGGTAGRWGGELDGEADLLIDAILGSGLQRDVGGDFAQAVAAVNAHGAPVAALDIPTGIHGDSGAVMGCAVQAALTVTFVGLKAGLFLADGRQHSGEVVYAGLGIGDEWRKSAPEYRRVCSHALSRCLPRRPRNAHKGDFGHVLVVGGGAGMPGAVRLCAEAALRGGAGLVSIATDPGHAAVIVASRPELMSHGISGTEDLEPVLEKADVVAFGPGLGRSDWAGALFARLAGDERPAVWDADALNWLAESPAPAAQRIITPHPGEAARLLGIDTEAVQGDRRAAVAALQHRYGGVVLLKGAGSLVSAGKSPPWLCTAGNPGMAVAGMGDVLTGLVAALLAQGLSIEEAAAVGMELHARAGDLAARRGERGMIASDLLAMLREVLNP